MTFLYGTYNWNRWRWLGNQEDREFVWKTITVSTKICSSQFKLCHTSRAGARDPLLLSHWLNYTDKWRWITGHYELCYSSVAFSLQCEREPNLCWVLHARLFRCLMCMCKYLWIWVPISRGACTVVAVPHWNYPIFRNVRHTVHIMFTLAEKYILCKAFA